jgi:NhaA family Na+:H+ antiporter
MRNSNRQRLRPIVTNFQRFLKAANTGGILLLIATVFALVWANSPYRESYESVWVTKLSIGIGEFSLSKSLLLWINDGLMAVFFFVVGLEIKREILVGEFSNPRKAIFPIFAALGGMLFPALIYFAVNGNGTGADGWAVPMATDIAFALGILSLLGRRAPLSLKIFLTAVAIVDDIGAVLVIAIFYSGAIAWSYLLSGFIVLIVLFAMNRLHVRNPIPYMALGIVLWFMVLQSGVHATVAGVLLAMSIPAAQRIEGQRFVFRIRELLDRFEKAGANDTQIIANRQQKSILTSMETTVELVRAPLLRLEHGLHPYVSYGIMPLFALANAGIYLGEGLGTALSNPITLGVFVGLVLGKQLGVTFFGWLTTYFGWAKLPDGLTWRQIYGAAWLTGIGFTMALFIAELAFTDNEQLFMAKVGILGASLFSAIVGSAILLSNND